mgnify:CR=1 FL=1|tara:strand:+ start:106 stop:291 length:186 start_codon:yes stop_codon:yes gene_type:complete
MITSVVLPIVSPVNASMLGSSTDSTPVDAIVNLLFNDSTGLANALQNDLGSIGTLLINDRE